MGRPKSNRPLQRAQVKLACTELEQDLIERCLLYEFGITNVSASLRTLLVALAENLGYRAKRTVEAAGKSREKTQEDRAALKSGLLNEDQLRPRRR